METTLRQELLSLLKKNPEAIQVVKCTLRQAIGSMPFVRARFDETFAKIYRYRWVAEEDFSLVPQKKFTAFLKKTLDKYYSIVVTPLKGNSGKIFPGEYEYRFLYDFGAGPEYVFSLAGRSLMGFLPDTGEARKSTILPWISTHPVPRGEQSWAEINTRSLFNIDNFERHCASLYFDVDKNSSETNWLNDSNGKNRWCKWKLQWSMVLFYKQDSRIRQSRYKKPVYVSVPVWTKYQRNRGLHQDMFVRLLSQQTV